VRHTSVELKVWLVWLILTGYFGSLNGEDSENQFLLFTGQKSKNIKSEEFSREISRFTYFSEILYISIQ
jgi:hypothetical protein